MQLALLQELPLFSSFSTFQAIIDFVLAVLELDSGILLKFLPVLLYKLLLVGIFKNKLLL